MRARTAILGGLVLAASGALVPRAALGQAMLADDVIVVSKGQQARKKARENAASAGTPTPGGGGSLLPGIPAGRVPGSVGQPARNALPPLVAAPPRMETGGVLSAASGYSTSLAARPRQTPAPAVPRPTPLNTPQYGTIEIEQLDNEGPPDGLTLDQAIDLLVHNNPDLLARFAELPKAQADTLTAGLRGNPIIFGSADSVPYGTYSPQRPGSNSYGIVLIQPLDVNGKRRARVVVAQHAEKVLEAQYQDAVRLSIDGLGMAFVDVLQAREDLQYKEANLKRLEQLLEGTRALYRESNQQRPILDRAAILRDAAAIERDAARSTLLQAKRALATLLHMPPGSAEPLEVRGSLRDKGPPPLPHGDLVQLALTNRPDVVAYRLAIHRAQAEVRLAKRERFEDVFLFYTPYGFTNYAYENQKSATQWSLGGMAVLPLFNRNQGNILRARETVRQTRIELSGIERQAIQDVDRAWQDYQTTLDAARRLEATVLPRAHRMRDDTLRLFKEGEVDYPTYSSAERDYNDIARQFRDTLILHRRSMLRLNTAVGQRILP